MNWARRISAFLGAFLLFFCLCGFVVTSCFLLFFHGIELPEAQVRRAAVFTFINVLAIAGLFTAFDTLRREITIHRPVRRIQQALDRITAGDFTVRLEPTSEEGIFNRIMASIDRMTGELSSVETLRTDFIASVSHEMKTPLTVIRNYCTLLQAPDLTEAQRLDYTRAIDQSARRLTSLITNVLKLNRLENQQIFPQPAAFDLGEQLCESLLQFESVWEEKDIELEVDIQEDVTLLADAELLEPVWNNLLSNAFKFTEPGGTVTVRLTADEEYARVQVSDTGCGMTPEVGARIFEKFYQGDTSHATQGNGLGLALVKRIIRITGGEISVSSTPGVGSTFTVRLRRAPHGEA
ncbi:MAG: HAMP domain-containing histidine kinase [Oscillospiraceae bacterium]|nr:HAMP domain-containing histidine kinase [Oscillospiraceae bacterium]